MKLWLRALLSTMSAFLGVQSNERRERDFIDGKFPVFVAAGITFTLLFLLAVYGLVQFVLWTVD